jgi:hypothetical protein
LNPPVGDPGDEFRRGHFFIARRRNEPDGRRRNIAYWHIATDANALTLRPLLGHYGSPARLVASDPRAFALHKAWLPHREDRESLKAVRDLEQAKAAATIATRYLKN